jgi:hypothetical protein
MRTGGAAAEVMPPFTDYSKAPQETNPNIEQRGNTA